MTTQDDYIESVLDNMPHATPQRSQIAMELRGHIAERLGFGHPLDEVLRQLGDPLKLAESYLSALPLQSAPLASRALAKLLDFAVVLVAMLLIVLPAAIAARQLLPVEWLLPLVPFLVIVGGSFGFAIYTVVAEHVYGQTLGKRLMGLRVVRESGARISLGQSIVRQLPLFLQISVVDALFAPFTQKRQRAFELVSKTRTVVAAPEVGR
jgi:uncharacterized RDD family membrane protein YckC